MVTFPPAACVKGRALLSGAVAVLLLLRAVLAVSADAPRAFAAPFDSVASTDLCAGDASDGAPSPHHAPDDRHCPVCLEGDRPRASDAVLPLSEPAAGQDAASHVYAVLPHPRVGPVSRACGWIGSWSSRAPPRG
jgi:hypothetical protein